MIIKLKELLIIITRSIRRERDISIIKSIVRSIIITIIERL